MTLRWLRRGMSAGSRAAALLALAQCGVQFDPSPFAEGNGSAADSESGSAEDDDEDDEEGSTGSPAEDDDDDADAGTTRPGSTSDTGASATTSVGTSTGFSDGTSTGNTTMGSSSTSGGFTSGFTGTTFMGDDTGGTTSTSGPGETMGQDPTGDEPVELDCDAPMPSSGAQMHSGNGRGGEGNLAWEIWSNTTQGELVTYDVPAFSAIWNEAGGYLGRLGYEWGGFGDTPVPHEQVGTITAQFASRKTGGGGLYSYVGMYGWTTNPCIEWYIIEDSFNNMPVDPGMTTEVAPDNRLQVDDGTYIIYTRPTEGTGGTRCSGATRWDQYYSIRTSARTCGTISLSEHFKAWEERGLEMGDLLEAKILVEVGGQSGRVDLPVANVMVTPP